MDFRSGWRVQIIAVSKAPRALMAHTIYLTLYMMCGEINMNRIIPYPPSFRRIPANTILPATGASTWALGSQR